MAATAAVLTLPLIWTSRWHVTGRDAFLVIMLGVLNTALSGTIYVAGLRKAQAHRAAILSYLEPVGAMALAWVFLSEQPTLTTLLGGGLILTGSYLVVRGEVVTV